MIAVKKKENYRESEEKRLLTLATEYLAKKKGIDYYQVEGIEYMDEGENFEHSYGVHLEPEEVRLLRTLMENPEEESTLEEQQDSIPFYDKLVTDGYNFTEVQPQKIDLDHPYRLYEFSMVTMKAPDSKPEKKTFRIHLSDALYVKLFLWRLKHREYSFNQLVDEMPQVYCNLTYSFIDHHSYADLWGCGFSSPFIIFMDEIDRDVFDAVGEPYFSEQVFEATVGDRCQHICLDIKERRMTFFLEDVTCFSLTGTRRYLEDIDAIAVQNSFGVDDYSDIHKKMTSLYGYGLAGFDDFKKYLDDNNIEYRYSETTD